MGAQSAVKRALYILQITRDKLSEESMKVLKCLLFYILRTTDLKSIVVEIYFDESEFSPVEDQLELILKVLLTGYNLTEPEHSSQFPLVQIDILLPQIFKSRSALLTDGGISHVYYNPETDVALPLGLIEERNADQTLPSLVLVQQIDQIKHDALAFAVELLRPEMGVIEEI